MISMTLTTALIAMTVGMIAGAMTIYECGYSITTLEGVAWYSTGIILGGIWGILVIPWLLMAAAIIEALAKMSVYAEFILGVSGAWFGVPGVKDVVIKGIDYICKQVK